MPERGIFYGGISLQRRTRTATGDGGYTYTWPTVSSPRGRITPLSLSEMERGAQLVGVVTHRFSTADATDVQKGDRIVFSGRTYEVQAVSTTSTGLRKQCLIEEVNDVGS